MAEAFVLDDVFPRYLHPCFKYNHFTSVQQKCMTKAFATDDSMVVCAPTGSGKTSICEAAFLRSFHRKQSGKTLYIAPAKSLLQERLEDWRVRFGENTVGMEFLELSSDAVYTNKDLNAAHVLLSTPEKWDVISRNLGPNSSFEKQIDVLLIDEIHHIGDQARGSTLEAIICQLKHRTLMKKASQQQIEASRLRIIGLSATFSNMDDIAAWIGCSKENCLQFGNDFRPVPLSYHVLGYRPGSNGFVFERFLDKQVYSVIKDFSGGKSTLVFCVSRTATARLAQQLAIEVKERLLDEESNESLERLLRKAKEVSDDESWLNTIAVGVGYHHAGLTPPQRAFIEKEFRDGNLSILCCTSSLAVGVNLPAHLVIVKSTQTYDGDNQYKEYPASTILQMMGRAGRPGMDTSATAVIMTKTDMKEHYRQVCSGRHSFKVDSVLDSRLAEILNVEIVASTVKSKDEAHEWIQSTYFALKRSTLEVDRVCDRAISELCLHGVATLDKSTGTLWSTIAGEIMSRRCVSLLTMKLLLESHPEAYSTFRSILTVLSMCNECYHPVRRSEKAFLKELSTKYLRYRVHEKDSKSTAISSIVKANILLQAAMNRSVFNDYGLQADMEETLEASSRIMAALVDHLYSRGCTNELVTAFSLWRSLRLRRWNDSAGAAVLAQVKGVDDTIAAGLTFIGIHSIAQLANSSPTELQKYIKRKADRAQDIIECAAKLPTFEAELKEDAVLTVKTHPDNAHDTKQNDAFALIVWTEERLLLFKKEQVAPVSIPLAVDLTKRFTVHVKILPEGYVGLDLTRFFRVPKQKPNVEIDEYIPTINTQRSSPAAMEHLPDAPYTLNDNEGGLNDASSRIKVEDTHYERPFTPPVSLIPPASITQVSTRTRPVPKAFPTPTSRSTEAYDKTKAPAPESARYSAAVRPPRFSQTPKGHVPPKLLLSSAPSTSKRKDSNAVARPKNQPCHLVKCHVDVIPDVSNHKDSPTDYHVARKSFSHRKRKPKDYELKSEVQEAKRTKSSDWKEKMVVNPFKRFEKTESKYFDRSPSKMKSDGKSRLQKLSDRSTRVAPPSEHFGAHDSKDPTKGDTTSHHNSIKDRPILHKYLIKKAPRDLLQSPPNPTAMDRKLLRRLRGVNAEPNEAAIEPRNEARQVHVIPDNRMLSLDATFYS